MCCKCSPTRLDMTTFNGDSCGITISVRRVIVRDTVCHGGGGVEGPSSAIKNEHKTPKKRKNFGRIINLSQGATTIAALQLQVRWYKKVSNRHSRRWSRRCSQDIPRHRGRGACLRARSSDAENKLLDAESQGHATLTLMLWLPSARWVDYSITSWLI
jgi:hypothetical protein